MTKTCFKCGQTKPLSDFYRHPQMADGHLNKCKVCTRYDVQINRDMRVEHYQNYDKARYPHRKDELAAQNKELRRRYPEKYKARMALGNAIRDGRVERKPCERCGTTINVQGHHTDYSRPFDVQWLCCDCHGIAHRKERIKPF